MSDGADDRLPRVSSDPGGEGVSDTPRCLTGEPPLSWVDLIIIVVLIVAAVHGWWRGAAVQLLSAGGFWTGLLLGVLIAPPLADLVPISVRGIVAILIVLVSATVLGTAGEVIGLRSTAALRRLHLAGIDEALGVVVALAGVLLAVWVIGNILASNRALASDRALQQSKILRALNDALPEMPAIFARIESFLSERNFPVVFVNLPPELLPPAKPPTDAAVRAALAIAGPSTVKVTGPACASIVEGSGFVAAPQTVITNAHVVAGDPRPRVLDASGAHAAAPIWFDPRLDIAVLRVPGLRDPPLRIHTTTAPRGSAAAAVGYPQNSGLKAVPAAVNGVFDATGLDIYGDALVTRQIYTLNADIEPGNSGGPLVSTGTATIPRGTVIGVIFARSSTDPGIGYALTSGAVETDLRKAQASGAVVSTGACSG